VTAVHVHAVANGGAGAFTYLGAATIGQPRPDVAGYVGFTDTSGLEVQTVNCQLGTYWCRSQRLSVDDPSKFPYCLDRCASGLRRMRQ
jgi:hypothetical protein